MRIVISKLKIRFSYIFIIILILCLTVKGNQITKEHSVTKNKFILLSNALEGDLGIATREIKGLISYPNLNQDPNMNSFNYEIEITKIVTHFEKSQTEANAPPKIQPFTTECIISQQLDIPLSINIFKGRSDDKIIYGRQNRIVYLILDMMFLTSAEKNLAVKKSESTNSLFCLDLEPYEKVSIDSAGDVPAWGMRTSISPNTFSAYPVISNKKLTGWEYISNTSDKLNIDYFYRFLDNDINIVTHAVNIKATSKQMIMEDEEYKKNIDAIDDPNNFQIYYSEELIIENSNSI